MTRFSSGPQNPRHLPVLVDEVVEALAIARGETLVDGTFGAGGYSRAMLAAGAGRVIGFDRDPDAIAAGPTLVPDAKLTLVEERFSQMDRVLAERGIGLVDGIALDIGVSSMQLDQAERGFSFQGDGPLDMRMSQAGESAADFLNTAAEDAIADVIYRYGEEPKSRRIARAIVAARPLTRTGELATVVRRALGHKPHDKKDPATRTFQAIRIHINRELDELVDGLAAAERVLKPGGRLAVVTFHSLEDRLVKRFLRDRSGAAPAGSRHLPVAAAAAAPSFESVGKAVRASEAEIARNPRARSATLRTGVRTAAPAWANNAANDRVTTTGVGV
jgi:16S rRNA (cytosine1402-N4)-methyltransferase